MSRIRTEILLEKSYKGHSARYIVSSGRCGFRMCCHGSDSTTKAHRMGRTVGEDAARRTTAEDVKLAYSLSLFFRVLATTKRFPFVV